MANFQVGFGPWAMGTTSKTDSGRLLRERDIPSKQTLSCTSAVIDDRAFGSSVPRQRYVGHEVFPWRPLGGIHEVQE